MLSIRDVMIVTSRHHMAMQQHKKPSDEYNPELQRWAFLVTHEELVALVDEMCSPGIVKEPLDPKTAEDFKAGKALLHLNGVPIMPELMLAPPLDG
jgi:hypothetical protein